VPRDRPLGRRAVEIEVIDRSFELLDAILAPGDPRIIQIVEGAYMAACRQREKRFGEAVVLAWSVCEQLISEAWRAHIDRIRSNDPDRVSKERREKLLGRDYTASMMVESLELAGVVDKKLYRMLDVTRRARNKWAHDMKVPKENEVYFANAAIEALLLLVKSVPISVQSGGRGGVPAWPIWMWESIKARGGPSVRT
jgi:hypothetical protein